jgi:hypothetical protein
LEGGAVQCDPAGFAFPDFYAAIGVEGCGRRHGRGVRSARGHYRILRGIYPVVAACSTGVAGSAGHSRCLAARTARPGTGDACYARDAASPNGHVGVCWFHGCVHAVPCLFHPAGCVFDGCRGDFAFGGSEKDSGAGGGVPGEWALEEVVEAGFWVIGGPCWAGGWSNGESWFGKGLGAVLWPAPLKTRG